MFGTTGLSGMCRDIQMDREAERSGAQPQGKDVKSHRKCGVISKTDRTRFPLIHCEKPVREADATCFTSARLTALY